MFVVSTFAGLMVEARYLKDSRSRVLLITPDMIATNHLVVYSFDDLPMSYLMIFI